jgi:ABC-2 type transport system permease protein
MLNPLLTMLVLTIIFSKLFRFTVENYAVYLLSGLIIWNFFSQTTTAAMSEMVWGGGLFHRVYLPKAVFASAALGTGVVNLALSIIPLLGIMLITGARIHLSFLFLPISMFIMGTFTMGVSLFLSAVAAFFADVVPIYEVVLTIWLYITPIIYPANIVPEHFQWILRVNPIFYLVDSFRTPIYDGTLPSLESLALATVFGVITLVFGWWFFTRRANEFAYRL